MAILLDSANRLFTLQTNHSMYQMKADRYGVLLHTWFGEKGTDFDYSYLINYADRGFSGNPYDAGEDRTYSLDVLSQEFPTYGSGDYRSCALKIRYPDGTYSCELRYAGYEIREGKYALPGLPALYVRSDEAKCVAPDEAKCVASDEVKCVASDEAKCVASEEVKCVASEDGFCQKEDGKADKKTDPKANPTEDAKADTLIVTLEDTRGCFFVHLYYGVLENLDIITRAVCIENHSDEELFIENIQSACVDYLNGEYDLHTFYGRHVKERTHQRAPLRHGIQSVGSTRGTSSHQYNPFLILSDRDTTEDSGRCYGFSFLYSGDFIAQAEYDQYNQTRVLMGIHPDNFSFCVEPGDKFYAPEVAMAYSGSGLGALSHIYHDAYRRNLCRGKWKDARRPVLLNSWEGVHFDFNGEKLVGMAKDAAKLGVELFVMDDGWFGKRELDVSGLGDWIVNEQKLGCTLRELSDQIHDLGMLFGIWFEPECVNEDSDLYRAHPDWALRVPGKRPCRSRGQLVLDFSREDVREYIFRHICEVLDSARIEYLKWDLNRSLSDLYSALLPAGRQGEAAHRFVLGLYDMLERLVQRYPDMLIEGCSGGGGRFDPGMLYYTPQIWCSDDTDAIERLSIQYGTSFAYPVSTIGAHVSRCPNEHTGRNTPFDTRATVAMAGTFGYELDVNKMSDKEKKAASAQIEEFKKYYDLIQYGDYYRLTDPEKAKGYHGWQFAAKDGSEALLCAVALQIRPNGPGCWMRFKGLKPKSTYLIDGKEYPGDVLMNGGLLLPMAEVEYESVRIHAVEK